MNAFCDREIENFFSMASSPLVGDEGQVALTAERGTTSESFGLAPRAVCNTKAPRAAHR